VELLRIEERTVRKSDLQYTKWVAVRTGPTGDSLLDETVWRYSPRPEEYVKVHESPLLKALGYALVLIIWLFSSSRVPFAGRYGRSKEKRPEEDEDYLSAKGAYDRKREWDREDLVNSLKAQGWEPGTEDEHGGTLTMQRPERVYS